MNIDEQIQEKQPETEKEQLFKVKLSIDSPKRSIKVDSKIVCNSQVVDNWQGNIRWTLPIPKIAEFVKKIDSKRKTLCKPLFQDNDYKYYKKSQLDNLFKDINDLKDIFDKGMSDIEKDIDAIRKEFESTLREHLAMAISKQKQGEEAGSEANIETFIFYIIDEYFPTIDDLDKCGIIYDVNSFNLVDLNVVNAVKDDSAYLDSIEDKKSRLLDVIADKYIDSESTIFLPLADKFHDYINDKSLTPKLIFHDDNLYDQLAKIVETSENDYLSDNNEDKSEDSYILPKFNVRTIYSNLEKIEHLQTTIIEILDIFERDDKRLSTIVHNLDIAAFIYSNEAIEIEEEKQLQKLKSSVGAGRPTDRIKEYKEKIDELAKLERQIQRDGFNINSFVEKYDGMPIDDIIAIEIPTDFIDIPDIPDIEDNLDVEEIILEIPTDFSVKTDL